MRETGHRHAVLGFGVVDAVAARDGALRFPRECQAAPEQPTGQLHRQGVTRPAEQVDGDDRRTAHCVDVRNRVGAAMRV